MDRPNFGALNCIDPRFYDHASRNLRMASEMSRKCGQSVPCRQSHAVVDYPNPQLIVHAKCRDKAQPVRTLSR
jgi:hypothetical protein